MSTPKGKYISYNAREIRERARQRFSVSGLLKRGALLCVQRTGLHELVKSTKYYSGDQIKDIQMDGARGKYGGENVYREGNIDAEGRIILKGILKIE